MNVLWIAYRVELVMQRLEAEPCSMLQRLSLNIKNTPIRIDWGFLLTLLLASSGLDTRHEHKYLTLQ